MSDYCPWREIGEAYPDVHVALVDIAPVRGAWIPSARVVLLDNRLTRPERRSVLAHELAHMNLGHRHRGFPWFDARQEREADALAARRLIAINDLADAYASTHDDAQLADALNVDVLTVRTRFAHLHPSERHTIEKRLALLERAT